MSHSFWYVLLTRKASSAAEPGAFKLAGRLDVSQHPSEPELRGFVRHVLEADRAIAVDSLTLDPHSPVAGQARDSPARLEPQVAP